MATAHELDDLNNVDLEGKLREAKEELFNLRFQAATGQLESHGRLRSVKKDIARIYTVVRERELGIGLPPAKRAAADQAAEAKDAKDAKGDKKAKKAKKKTKDES